MKKKLFFLSVMLLLGIGVTQAQVVRVYETDNATGTTTLVKTYANSDADKYKVKFKKSPVLIGEFSVSSSKKVLFTCGNLYWDGSNYKFENAQYIYPTTKESNHVGHFYWLNSSDTNKPYAESFACSSQGAWDEFWCGENNPLTVDGKSGYYAMTTSEWTYLIQTRTNAANLYKTGVSVSGSANCVVIAPDDYAGSIASSYTAEEWKTAEGDGLVCMPAAGVINSGKSSASDSGNMGEYWSASPMDYIPSYAKGIWFSSSSFNQGYNVRELGYAIRLVKTVSE